MSEQGRADAEGWAPGKRLCQPRGGHVTELMAIWRHGEGRSRGEPVEDTLASS